MLDQKSKLIVGKSMEARAPDNDLWPRSGRWWRVSCVSDDGATLRPSNHKV